MKGRKLEKEVRLELLKLFLNVTQSRKAATLLNINRHTANLFYNKLRKIILKKSKGKSKSLGVKLSYTESLDKENYLYKICNAKTSWIDERTEKKVYLNRPNERYYLFGFIKKGHKIYTAMLTNLNHNKPNYEPIAHQIRFNAILTLPNGFNYNRKYINPNNIELSIEQNDLNSNDIQHIQSFCLETKHLFELYQKITRKNFHLFLKEAEFRFNYVSYKDQLRTLRKWADI